MWEKIYIRGVKDLGEYYPMDTEDETWFALDSAITHVMGDNTVRPNNGWWCSRYRSVILHELRLRSTHA